ASATPLGVSAGLDGPRELALSSDGTSLYAASTGDDAIARFERDTTTGALTYKGCITGRTETGPAGSGACTAIPSANSRGSNSGLDAPQALALSADGRSLYAAAERDDAVARFRRNTTTGALAYKGCVTGDTQSGPGGSGACAQIASAALRGSNSGL